MGKEEPFESFKGLHIKGPRIFEYNDMPSQQIKRLHINEKGNIVGNIVFITKFSPTKDAFIQSLRFKTNRIIENEIKKFSIKFIKR